MRVNLDNLFDGCWLEQNGRDSLFDCQNNAVRCSDADRRGPELDGLDGVLDLEKAAFRREGVDATIVLAACQKHC